MKFKKILVVAALGVASLSTESFAEDKLTAARFYCPQPDEIKWHNHGEMYQDIWSGSASGGWYSHEVRSNSPQHPKVEWIKKDTTVVLVPVLDSFRMTCTYSKDFSMMLFIPNEKKNGYKKCTLDQDDYSVFCD
jgi:hypothetical protein